MSVIIASAGACCGSTGTPIPTNTQCLPAISLQKLIISGTAGIVDSLSTVDWGSVKWLVVISNSDNTKIKSYELHGCHEFGLKPNFNIYAIMGDKIFHSLNTVINGSNLELQITNNEPLDIVVYITRIAVPLRQVAFQNLIGLNITGIHAAIAPGDSKVVDSFQYWGVHAVKWIVTATDPTDNKITTQVFAVMQTGFIGNSVEYALIGQTTLQYTIECNASLNEVQLVINNNDTVNMFIDVTRIPIESKKPPLCDTPSSNLSIWVPGETIINANNSEIIDLGITVPGHNAVKWLVYIRQASTNKAGAFELAVTRHGFITYEPVLYSIISTYFDLDVNISIVNLNMMLNITNNETSPITINLIRVPVSL